MKIRDFKPTSWSIDNRVSVFVLTIIITLAGLLSYSSLPKEQFPDIVIPTIYVSSFYNGTSPPDIESLITRPIEKEIKSVAGIKKINSSSVQDYSAITVEFLPDIEPAIAKQRVADAVDRAKNELPTDMETDPQVLEVDFSEFPIMTINVSGEFELDKLKSFAEDIQDEVEGLKEITRVDIIGAPENEVQVDVDVFRMEAAGITFDDIARAISNENVNISGGEVNVNDLERTLRVVGEYTNVRQIEEVLVNGSSGAKIFLKNIATVKDAHEEQKSFARLNGLPVISLSVIKKSGENLIAASDKIAALIDDLRRTRFPDALEVTLTNDQSVNTRVNLANLTNSIIIGFILVTITLMFFMGVRNAIFVGLAVPLSSALSFIVLPAIGFTFNIIVSFGFLLALGIIVDNAIVVIENTHRLYARERHDILKAAKLAAGEVFTPVLAGTLTTLAPFIPLLFWPGLIGEFMYFLPVVLIITLTASLFVAFIINPVFAVQFMNREEKSVKDWRGFLIAAAIMLGIALLAHAAGNTLIGNLFLAFIVLGAVNKVLLTPVLIKGFQNKVLPAMMRTYEKLLSVALRRRNPYWVVTATVALLFVTIVMLIVFAPGIELFPEADPNNVFVYIEMPQGTRAPVTDSITQLIEERVNATIANDMNVVKSVISNVGVGAGDPQNPDRNVTPHKGKVTVAFVEFALRNGRSTKEIMTNIRDNIRDIPGARVTVEKEQGGPPTGKPVNVEIAGDEFVKLIDIAENVRRLIVDTLRIEGIEELKSDLELNKPEIIVDINRSKALEEGLSSAQIGRSIRTALYGDEVSQFRSGEDEYPIQLRLDKRYRNDINALLNLKLTLAGPNGQLRQIPISSVADVYYANTYGGINRIDLTRVITLASNVLEGYNPTQINDEIRKGIADIELPLGYSIKLTGEQQDQEETQSFLGLAFLFATLLVFFIMVTQFNSAIKPIIILTTILFSVIGVLMGHILTGMTISVVMTGVGIVSLAGIVVNNGILLIDFTDILKKRGLRTRRAVIEGGAIRFTPVTLTAISTMLGLVPLAVGLNIDFASLFSSLDPGIYFGGDSTAFWAPLALSIIFGLSFSTFLTLVVVPCMYIIQYAFKVRMQRIAHKRRLRARLRATGGSARPTQQAEPGITGA